MTDRDWLKPGAEVGIHDHLHSARRTRIERMTKTLVITEDGDRFPLSTLSRSGGTWGPFWTLTTVDDQRFLRVESERRVSLAKSRALAAVEEWRVAAGRSPELARKAASLLRQFAEVAEGEARAHGE